MKTKNLLLLGLAAVGGFVLWKKLTTKAPAALPFEPEPSPRAEQQAQAALAAVLPNRTVEAVLQNGTIVAGVGEILPPSPMEMAWDYPGLQSSHAPGRIYKV